MMRSVLFVPADSPAKYDKALGSNADGLILDLEDSVSAAARPGAREGLAELLARDRRGKTIFVRVNALGTDEALPDLAAAMTGAPDGILLPKCVGGADVARLGDMLSAFETAHGLPLGETRIFPIATENAAGLLALPSLAPAHPRLMAMMWGAEDLAADLGSRANRALGRYTDPFRTARTQLLLAAAAAGVPAYDTVFTDIRNLDALATECDEARRDGFAGKVVIHPSHIDPVNAAFTPTEEEIAHARRIVAFFDENPDAGVSNLDGQMIDKPHERAARRLLSGLPD